MDKIGILAGPIEDEHGADRRPLLDGELKVAAHGKRPVDAQDDRPLAAIVALMEGDGGRDRRVANTRFGLFADQATAGIAGFPSGQLLAVPLGRARRAVGICQGRAERHEVVDQLSGHGFSMMLGGKQNRRR